MTTKDTAQTAPRRAGNNDPLSQGMARHQAGDHEAAEQLYRKVGRRDQHYGEALRLRGLIARQRGDVDQAIKLIRRAVDQQRTNAVFHHTLAEVLRSAGQWQAAIVSYQRAWKLMPERDETGEDLARARAQAGRVDAAVKTWRQLLERAASPARIHTQIARLYHEHGYPQAALDSIETWRKGATDNAQDWHELGRAYVTIRQPKQAIPCYRKALEHAPDHAHACAGLGNALQLHGAHDEACVWLEKALDLKPELGWVYPALAAIRNHELSDERRATLERLADDASVPEWERMHMQFALGTLHDRKHEHEQAFRRFESGNRIHARRKPFDPGIFEDRIDRMTRLFDRQFFERRADHGLCSDKPLFIVGMPRSGTSLVEQIIASHPAAHGAGELEVIGAMVRELPAITDTEKHFPESVAALDKPQSKILARRYLDVLNAHGGTAARVTDKMPMNFLRLGLIAVLFPDARVVYCRRDAMDNCLSCYFQIFHDSLLFTYDQAHLAHVYRQHERLMAHWVQNLPLNMMTVDYEQLVGNQEEESRRLIEFAGLPWDDRCLSFHETRRDVQTASTWQVRQPMYQSSVARWRAYEPWLQKLREKLVE